MPSVSVRRGHRHGLHGQGLSHEPNCVTIAVVVLRIVCVFTVLVLSAPAGAQPAGAQPAGTTEADRLFEQGRALAKAGQYQQACDQFARSLKLDYTVGTELNLADCHEKLGHLRESWQLFIAAAAASARTSDAKRTAFARARAAAVEARMTTVVVRVARPLTLGLAITIANHEVTPTAEIRDHTDPGPIDVVATVPGHPRFAITVNGAAGATVTIDVPGFGEMPATAESPRLSRRRSRVHLAWGLGAGSVVTAIAGMVFSLEGRSRYNTTADGPSCMHVAGGITCDADGDRKIADAQKLADVGTVFAIGSGALLAGSAAIYFMAPRDRMRVAPTLTGNSVGLAVRGTF